MPLVVPNLSPPPNFFLFPGHVFIQTTAQCDIYDMRTLQFKVFVPVAWVLIQQHTLTCDWLSLTESFKENYKYTTSNKISMSSLLIFFCESVQTVFQSHILCAHMWEYCWNITHFYAGFFFDRNVSKVKRLFIGGATSLDTRWCHKSRKALKSKHQSELRGGSNKSRNHSLLPRLWNHLNRYGKPDSARVCL